jgi:tetratricopeptide (TPR) repeat protein
MAGVVNSQSYSTTVITGNMSGKLLNDSYAHWVIAGDLSGDFTNKSAATLRVLGKFSGKIDLGNHRDRRFAKVFLAGKTTEGQLERIEGRGIVYLPKSDLDDGVHQIRDLTVVIGDHQPTNEARTDVDPNFQQAWKLFFARNYVESEKLFRKVLEGELKNPHAMNGLGWSLINQEKYAEAKPWINRAIDIEKEHWGALSGLGLILKHEGDIDGAVAVWERIATNAEGPNDATANLADVAMERGQYDKALGYYKKMLEWYPDRAIIREKIVEIEAKLKSTQE